MSQLNSYDEEAIPPVTMNEGSKHIAAIEKVLADPEATAKIRRESEAAISSDHTTPSTSTQKSDLQCIQCKLDPSVSYQKKDTAYTHSELNEHLKSNFHTRREQVLRCFNIDKDENGQCRCPCCGDDSTVLYKEKAFISHMESDHHAVMKF